MLFLGIKKIPLKEKYAFIVLEIFDFIVATFTAGYARSTGPSHMVSSHMVLFYSPTWWNGEEIYEVGCLFMAICLIHFAAQTAYYHI